MANYAASVASPMNGCERISRSLGVFSGTVNITNYNTTLLEITGITRYFKASGVSGFTKGLMSVVCDQVSSLGYVCRWDYGTGSFKAFLPTSVAIAVDSNVGAGAALLFGSGGGAAALHATSAVGNITLTAAAVEAAADTNIGTLSFVAVGFRGA